jgi:hypothetical protein
LCSAKYLPASVSSLGLAFESVWQYAQAFLVDFVYSGLPWEDVGQTRKPTSKMAAGKVIFQLDIMPTHGEMQFQTQPGKCPDFRPVWLISCKCAGVHPPENPPRMSQLAQTRLL